jgi:molybdopterin-guanine dinucleotide biosynthesis protein A
MTDEFIASIQPIVLVGGRSRRFGRDKLIEPWGDGVLVQRPIDALRAMFGPRVRLVGDCDARLPALADGVIPDLHPGAGPMGGIISALAGSGQGVFVLAGDMPACDPGTIRRILAAAKAHPLALAALARTDRLHPCVGLYRHGALAVLEARLREGSLALHSAFERGQIASVECDPRAVTNVNHLEDVERAPDRV